MRARLRPSPGDEAVLRTVGAHLGSLAGKDLAVRCAEGRLETGTASVVRGGKALLRVRNNLAAAGLTQDQWRQQWESARLFLTADGEAASACGNQTIRWHPDQGWLEIKLPAPLAQLANQPHGRYRLSCLVGFSYRGE